MLSSFGLSSLFGLFAGSHQENAVELVLEKDRYRLYAAASCPFAHRVRLVRLLYGMEDSIAISWVTGQTSESFTFDQPEPEFGALTLREVYNQAADASFKEKRATVPMLLDKTTKKMVNNESLELAVTLASQCKNDQLDLLPDGAEDLCRDLNDKVNLAVYKFLFQPDNQVKQEIADALHAELEKYNGIIGNQPYLMGETLTLPDLLFWPTIIRYDNVYARQFGLKGKTIRGDYPNLAEFAKRIGALKSQKGDTTLAEDARLPEIVRLYWQSGNLAPKAGNDPMAPVPELLPVF